MTLKEIADQISLAKNQAEELRDDLQSKFDELSEKAQGEAKGEALSEKIAALEEALGHLESAEDSMPGEQA